MLTTLVAAALLAPAPLQKRWFYLATNLLVDANVESGISLVKRAKSAGYNGLLVADSKFCRWDDLPARYGENVARFRKAVSDAGMELVAAVAPIGYSNDLLSRDPDLAEGLPVVDAPFRAAPDHTLVPLQDCGLLRNGGFEDGDGSAPAAWSWVDEPGKVCVLDSDVKSEGARSLRMQDAHGGNARACQRLAVKPHRYFHVHAEVKTDRLETPGNVNVTVLGKSGQSLQHTSIPIKPTMDWIPVDVAFNTLDNDEVSVYVGVWGMKGGTIWWDNVKVEPGGLVNVVRRAGAPFRVRPADSEGPAESDYVEGTDFDGARDPKCGRIAWPGDYNVWHEQPAMTVPAGSRIKPGATVLVSYSHTAIVYDGQVTVCLGEPKLMEILKWQIRQVHQNLRPDGYMLSHDEIRVGGWDAGCTQTGKPPGALLAENARQCVALVRAEDPGKAVYAWSDMFDPNHNAAQTGFYYLLKGEGPWKGSWAGLDEDVVILNWNMQDGVREKSYAFFDGRGHRQILAGYYDGGGVPIEKWVREAKQPLGAMYTTWQSRYDDLESFAKKAWPASVPRQ